VQIPRPSDSEGAYSASTDPSAGFKGLLLREESGGEERRGRKGRGGRGGNIAFHHLLLSNLTTAYIT